jgi:hypothetical protein
MIRVNARPRRKNSGKADALRRCEGHLQWLRGRPCLLDRRAVCGGRIEAAHVDHAGGKGMAIKTFDANAVPLCSDHHAEYHRGARTFEAMYAIDLVAAARRYAALSPHREKLQSQLAAAR